MVAAQPLQLECSDDIHCSAGSYCEEYHCFVCIDCNTYNREKPKTNSESCIKSVLDCGKCLEGFVDDRSSEFYPRCGAPGGGGGVSNWVILTVVAALLVLLLLCVVVVVALRRTRLITSVRTSLESHCVVNRLWPSAPPAPPTAPPTAPAPAPPKPESPPPYDLIAPPYNGGPQGDLGESDEQWAMRQRAAAAAARRIGAGLRPRTSPPRDESQSPLVKAGVPRRARLARASAHSATPFNRPDSTYSAAPLNPAYETDEEDSFHLENHFLHNVETTPDTWSPDADTTTLTDDRLRTPASGELAAVDGAAAPRADGEFTSFSAAFASHPLSPFRTAADAVPPASPDLNPAHPTLPAHPTPPAHTAHPAQSPPEGGGDDGGAAGLGDGSTRQQNVINFMVRLTNVNQHIAG